MDDLNSKFEAADTLLKELRSRQAIDPETVAQTLINILALARSLEGHPRQEMDLLEHLVEERTFILTEKNKALQKQTVIRKSVVRRLRNDNKTLRTQLQTQIEENKRTKTLEREQRALTEALRDTIATMSSTLDLNKVLDQILDTVGRVTPYDGANVLFVESDMVHMVRQRGYVEKGQKQEWLNQRTPIIKLGILQHIMDLGQPMAISDTSTSSMWVGFPGSDWIQSNVIAPIRLKEKVLGFLSLDSATAGFFTQIHAERLQTFAGQTAIAIHNARLYDRAKQDAILAERNRLASELHDTISQTLWSMSLITERLPSIWNINREEAERGLTTLHAFAQSALTEMRSLLLELRPSELTDAKLGDLIRQLASVVSSRTGLVFSITVASQETLPAHIQTILYRVTQESLNNITRHALATHIEIYFSSENGHVKLSIQDDGRGFDPEQIEPGHLGLSIMQERIQNIGGTLDTISKKGEGTLIKVSWNATTNQKGV